MDTGQTSTDKGLVVRKKNNAAVCLVMCFEIKKTAPQAGSRLYI